MNLENPINKNKLSWLQVSYWYYSVKWGTFLYIDFKKTLDSHHEMKVKNVPFKTGIVHIKFLKKLEMYKTTKSKHTLIFSHLTSEKHRTRRNSVQRKPARL